MVKADQKLRLAIKLLLSGFQKLGKQVKKFQNKKGGDGSMATPRNTRRSGGQQGFASMDEDERSRIASKGGRAAHQQGTAHEFTSEEAREAGRKGGKSSRSTR